MDMRNQVYDYAWLEGLCAIFAFPYWGHFPQIWPPFNNMGPIPQTISIHILNVLKVSFCFNSFPGHPITTDFAHTITDMPMSNISRDRLTKL